jgi:ABC-type Fe3+-hydroxamate transport system substrate-binding protein
MMLRVVSLVPSVSETLVAWGVTPVAVTRFCAQPGLVTVGGTKTPDIDAIVALHPDLVVVDREENRRSDAGVLEAAGLTLQVTAVRSVADVAPTLAGLRDALGIGADTDAETEIAPGPATCPAPGRRIVIGGHQLRVWVPIWRRPWMSISSMTYGSSVLEACGACNVLGGHAEPYPKVTLEEVAALDVDVVLAPTEPYPSFERHRAELATVAPVVVVDGQDLFWWGARTPAAIRRLSRQLARIGAGDG